MTKISYEILTVMIGILQFVYFFLRDLLIHINKKNCLNIGRVYEN